MLMLPVSQIIRDADIMSDRLSSTLDMGLAVEPKADFGFEGQMQHFSLGALRLARLAFSPHLFKRSPRYPRPTRNRYLLCQLVAGELLVRQDGREAHIRAGDFILINPARDFRIEAMEIVINAIGVDAHTLRAVHPEVEYQTAVAFAADDPSIAMVSRMITDLFEGGGALSGGARDRCGEALPHIMAIALATRTTGELPCPSKLSLFHKERIKSYIREHLWDSQLNCQKIAGALRLSQRYIYDVFADEPLTLMRWIRRERLLRCRRELSSATLRNRSISDIAYSWGFIDPAHFSRVFSAEFGKSPRAFRQSQTASPELLN